MQRRASPGMSVWQIGQVSTPNSRDCDLCGPFTFIRFAEIVRFRGPWAIALEKCLLFRVIRLRGELSGIEQIRDRLRSHSVRMKKSELTLKQVSAIPCPTCGVAIGMPCVLHSGGKRLEPHVDRKLAAIEALEGNSIYSGQQYYFFASSPLK